MQIGNKRGSEIALAAFVLPVVFLCVFAVFAYASHLYEDVRMQGEGYKKVRAERICGGTITWNEADFIRQMDLLTEDE